MSQFALPRSGTISLADLAAAIGVAPEILKGADTACLRVVAYRAPDKTWQPFATRFDVGADTQANSVAIEAGPDLWLIRIVSTASKLDAIDELRAFLQSWRTEIGGGALPVLGFQELVTVDRQGGVLQDHLHPRWRFSLYEAESKASNFPTPRGPFPAPKIGFFGSNIGHAAAQWIDDSWLTDTSSARPGIDVNIWDYRAAFSSREISESEIRLGVESRIDTKLVCNTVFKDALGKTTSDMAVVENGRAVVPIPATAGQLETYLIGADGFAFDQTQATLPGAVQAPGFFPRGQLIGNNDDDPFMLRHTKGNETAATQQRSFVHGDRLAELRQASPRRFDFSRLIRLLEELNACHQNACWMAVAALTRAVLDHVPPIFDATSFKEIVNNRSGSRSFREAMAYLDNPARKIGDAYLHEQIRAAESLPNENQVDFSRELDLLLAEIVRRTKSESGDAPGAL